MAELSATLAVSLGKTVVAWAWPHEVCSTHAHAKRALLSPRRMSAVRVGRVGASPGKRRARTRARTTHATSAHLCSTARTAWSHTLADTPPQTAVEGALQTASKRHKSIDADAHLQDASALACGRLLRAKARPSAHAGHPAACLPTDARQVERKPPPDRPTLQPERAAEHEAVEALHEEHVAADRAMLGALSEYVGHDGPTLLLCESRRADKHLQVSCARASHTSEVSCSHNCGLCSRSSQPEADSP